MINKKLVSTTLSKYQQIKTALQKDLGYNNINEVPSIEKVVLNVGFGKFKEDKAYMEKVLGNLETISMSKPILTTARKSIAGFKLRDGMKIGAKVTLRGSKMYYFLDKLIYAALPRIRDFHGLSIKAFDGQGNYSIGLVDHNVFPEIPMDDTMFSHSLQCNIIIKAKKKEDSIALLNSLGMPIERSK
jgi:large subunit ribosomal protein L5